MARQINRSHAAFLKWLAPLGQAAAGLFQWTNRGDGWRWLARIVCRAKHRCFHAWAYSGPLAALAGLFFGFVVAIAGMTNDSLRSALDRPRLRGASRGAWSRWRRRELAAGARGQHGRQPRGPHAD